MNCFWQNWFEAKRCPSPLGLLGYWHPFVPISITCTEMCYLVETKNLTILIKTSIFQDTANEKADLCCQFPGIPVSFVLVTRSENGQKRWNKSRRNTSSQIARMTSQQMCHQYSYGYFCCFPKVFTGKQVSELAPFAPTISMMLPRLHDKSHLMVSEQSLHSIGPLPIL